MVRRMVTTIVADYEERTATIQRHTVNVTSYRLGERYICGIDNIDPGVTICRTTGPTRRDAIEKALKQAVQHLAAHSYVKDLPSPGQFRLAKLIYDGDPQKQFSVSDFVAESLSDRMNYILSGMLHYVSDDGREIPAGDAMQLLKSAVEQMGQSTRAVAA